MKPGICIEDDEEPSARLGFRAPAAPPAVLVSTSIEVARVGAPSSTKRVEGEDEQLSCRVHMYIGEE